MSKEKKSIISYTSTPEQLSDFLKKIKDLTSINQRILMRIERDNILIFSFVGESLNNIHAFKNYIFPTNQIMDLKKNDIEDPLFLVVKDGKKLYRTLENILDYDNIIKCKISLNDENYINSISFDNNKLKIQIIGSDPLSVGNQINIDDINHLTDINKSIFNFKISRNDFLKIKKMGQIERVENDTKTPLYINIIENKLTIGETKWNMTISDIEYENMTFSFPKIYFNTINPLEFIHIYVFDEFILCKYDDYNLMILLETFV